MLCYILTTGQCNLKCRYCGGSFPENLVPYRVKYSINELRNFLSDAEDLTIAFYGGEPLLNASWIVKVMDEVDAKHYVIQTNGLLIDNLDKDYWLRFNVILLSIDGIEQLTDYNRGKGVYQRVIRAVEKLRSMGYEGEIVARMTVTEMSDIYRDVGHLLSLGLFDTIHWQLDAIWSPKRGSFKSWLNGNYIPRLKQLVDMWVNELLNGKVLGIAPFKAIMSALIDDRSLGMPPCGAGWNALAINTNGDVLACPIAVDVKWARLGNIKTSTFKELLRKVEIKEPCTKCKYVRICGGRCLYAHKERLWGEEGFKMLCEASITLINSLIKAKPKVEWALKNNIISMKELRYPPFLNSIEIIP